MDNSENFQQLKRKMMWIFKNEEEIPEEVKRIIQQMFNELEQEYQRQGCHTTTIQEYIQGNLAELMAQLKRGIGARRKNNQFDDIQVLVASVERELKENLDREKQNRRDSNNRDRIGDIGKDTPNNIRITLNTMDLIQEYLRDVQSRQNRILHSRGLYGDSKIADLNDYMQSFITKIRNDNEGKVHGGFEKDNEQLRQELLQAFEEYVDQRGKKENTKQNDFRTSLDVKDELTLTEQSANLKKFLANNAKEEGQGSLAGNAQEQGQESLAGNAQEQGQESLAVDELPESTL